MKKNSTTPRKDRRGKDRRGKDRGIHAMFCVAGRSEVFDSNENRVQSIDEDKQALLGRSPAQFYFLPNLHDYTQLIMHKAVRRFMRVGPEACNYG